eukprot:SAG22_NODE_2116_length_2987_cov_8.657202_2_plen_185_part_00
MSAATVEALRAEYKVLYENHARGSKCMDATWLRARINAKGVPGPAGVQGPIGKAGKTGKAGAQGKTGKAGAQGQRGKVGAQGQRGKTGARGPPGPPGPTAPPPFMEDIDYDGAKRLRNPRERVNKKIELVQFSPVPLHKLKEAAGLLGQAKEVQQQLGGMGNQIATAQTDSTAKKEAVEEEHEA